jgi:glutamine synthetase
MQDEIGLKQKIENLETDKVKFAVTDIDGVLRGKIISKAKLLKGIDEGLGFCNVIFGWDVNDVAYDNTTVSGWHTGYPDSIANIDLTTCRNIPWNDNIPFFLADFSNSKEVASACPRTLLKQVRQQCIDKGFNPQFAKEFEWFNFKETSQSLKERNFYNPEPFTSGMFGYSVLRLSQNKDFYNDLFNLLQQFAVPLEGLHTETGDGVCEAAIDYTDILEAADRAVLFKSSIKEIASRHGLMACFMAKWSSDFPGCSGHIHQSLWNADSTRNLFYDENVEHNISELLRHYIAGQLFCLPYILPMYAPTVNSYKRYVEGAWASTSVSWGIENRTAALRVINHSHSSMRLETRVPGADANPYLSLAASLASGLYGIENKLSLDVVQTKGNEYTNTANQKFPKTLKEATDAMKGSDLANKLFGEAFVDHFIKTREWEWKQFIQKVTDWELRRYFEII